MADFTGYAPTGLSEESFKRMTNGAGAAYLNLDLEGGELAPAVAEKLQAAYEAGDCLGATRGGFDFDFSMETRSPEADGKFFEYKGSRKVTAVNCQVGFSALEASPKLMKLALPTSVFDATKRMLRLTRSIQEDAYIKNLWVMCALTSGGYIGFKFKNALAIEGTSPSTSNDDEAEFPVTFVAHQEGLTDTQNAPCDIYWFPVDENEDIGLPVGQDDEEESKQQGAAPAKASASNARAARNETPED